MGEVVMFPGGVDSYWSAYRKEIEPSLYGRGYSRDVVERILVRLETYCASLFDRCDGDFSINLMIPGDVSGEQQASILGDVSSGARNMAYAIIGHAMAAALFAFVDMEAR